MSDSEVFSPKINGNELKYVSLADSIRRRILAGAWPMGTKIPTEKELLASTGLSLTTVRRAFQQLVEEGLVERRRGAGTFVAEWKAPRDQHRSSVGIMTPEIEAYYRHIIRGVQDHLTSVRAGTALLATYQWEPEGERAALQRLLDSGVDGLIITPTMKEEDDGLKALQRLHDLPIPVVLAERSALWAGPAGRMEHVISDHPGGAFDAVSHLHGLGHRRIGLVFRSGAHTSRGVVQGYQAACDHFRLLPWSHQLPPKPVHAPLPQPAVVPAAAALLDSDITAVLVFGDREASLLQSELLSRGAKLPEEMSMVSYDDETADLATIPLTAIAPAKYQLGQLAARKLLNRIQHGDSIPLEQTQLRPVLVVRDSTMPPAP